MRTTDDAEDDLQAALAAAERLGEEALPVHVEAFERVHTVLQDRLARADG
ncbi:hypothetical protein LQF12_06865 [Ruania suaedae]|nr:hypothetical protein [Ruania suaedae]UFU04293.1 hypothetical protein LQF12_06865 [Ruania suaedae]